MHSFLKWQIQSLNFILQPPTSLHSPHYYFLAVKLGWTDSGLNFTLQPSPVIHVVHVHALHVCFSNQHLHTLLFSCSKAGVNSLHSKVYIAALCTFVCFSNHHLGNHLSKTLDRQLRAAFSPNFTYRLRQVKSHKDSLANLQDSIKSKKRATHIFCRVTSFWVVVVTSCGIWKYQIIFQFQALVQIFDNFILVTRLDEDWGSLTSIEGGIQIELLWGSLSSPGNAPLLVYLSVTLLLVW